MLEVLGAPARLWEKTPTADLLDEIPGESDESSLGVSYDVIDAFLCGERVNDRDRENIERKYRASEHKRRFPVTVFDTWWTGRGSE